MTHFHPRGKIERGGEGEAGNTTHAHPPRLHQHPLCIGGKKLIQEEKERVWDSSFYPSFLKVEGVYIYIYILYICTYDEEMISSQHLKTLPAPAPPQYLFLVKILTLYVYCYFLLANILYVHYPGNN